MVDWMLEAFFIFAGVALVGFLWAWKAGHFHDLERQAQIPLRIQRRTTTRPNGRLTKRSGTMTMPSGDTPDDARDFYLYLQGHHESQGRVETWHVDWLSLAWLWGFVIVLSVVLLLWVRQYRSTRQRAGIYPLDRFGGWTSETAGPGDRVLPPLHRR